MKIIAVEPDSTDQFLLSRMYVAPDIAELILRLGFAWTTVLKHLNRLRIAGLVIREKVPTLKQGDYSFCYERKTFISWYNTLLKIKT